MSHLPLMQISARKLHFWSSNWFGAINLAEETLTEIEFWAGMSILSFGESRSSVRPWHPRDYIKHMSRDDVINTSDADHMVLNGLPFTTTWQTLQILSRVFKNLIS